MTADEFVKIVRKGSDKLRVDEIIINTGSQELHGKGMLRISRKKSMSKSPSAKTNRTKEKNFQKFGQAFTQRKTVGLWPG